MRAGQHRGHRSTSYRNGPRRNINPLANIVNDTPSGMRNWWAPFSCTTLALPSPAMEFKMRTFSVNCTMFTGRILAAAAAAAAPLAELPPPPLPLAPAPAPAPALDGAAAAAGAASLLAAGVKDGSAAVDDDDPTQTRP